MTMWGGRFQAEPSAHLRQLNDSFAFDRELFAEDVQGSIAWARALERAAALSAAEGQMIIEALRRIASDPALQPQAESEQEDIHSFVEAQLFALIGPLAGKLHTGRSRNDQVATDVKLWLKSASHELAMQITSIAEALIEHAAAEAATAMPGYTHSRQAEPITFGHWALAYVEMMFRDLARLRGVVEANDSCPLGAGALSGTPLPIDRVALAQSLGFARAAANSIDAVSDRDFVVDYLYCASTVFSHLSRLAEDLIFFSTDEAGYVELPDALATGSSRMPQKKNPDVLELLRGYAGRAIGEITGLLALMKGLPLAYDKDLQLDKEPLFRTRKALRTTLAALDSLLRGLILKRDRMRTAASGDLLLATDLADALAARGIPFREAHGIVSRRIGEALRAGKTLKDLGPSSEITADDLRALDVDRVLSKHVALGGSSPDRVRTAAEAAKKRLAAEGTFADDTQHASTVKDAKGTAP